MVVLVWLKVLDIWNLVGQAVCQVVVERLANKEGEEEQEQIFMLMEYIVHFLTLFEIRIESM